MVTLVRITESGLTPGNLVRETRRCQKEAFEQLGGMWHSDFRDKHFTHEGAAEYGYTPRQGEEEGIGTKRFFRSYTGRKLRKFGHTNPLVWSGLSHNLTRIKTITATAAGCRVTMPANFNRRPAGGKIDMNDEFQRISAREVALLERRGKTELEGRLHIIR